MKKIKRKMEMVKRSRRRKRKKRERSLWIRMIPILWIISQWSQGKIIKILKKKIKKQNKN